MSASFHIVDNPDSAVIAPLSDLDPVNPFATSNYADSRRRMGDHPILFMVRQSGVPVGGAIAYSKFGRVSRSLEFPSQPNFAANIESHPEIDTDFGHVFWAGLATYCRDAAITELTLNSFASSPGTLTPSLDNEVWRKQRWEFLLPLDTETPFVKLRKGHSYSIKKAIKNGITLQRATDLAACEAHAQLMDSSMQRRIDRGEGVTTGVLVTPLMNLLDTGAGVLFQAVQNDVALSSNLILLSPRGAYNHTSGTSADGMQYGAAQFLIHEMALALKAEGKTVFNLGGTDQKESGLERFKSGFGKSVIKTPLDAAHFAPVSRLRGASKNFFERIKTRGS